MSAVRVAALADLHCSRSSEGRLRPIFARVEESADLLLIAGDLTDYGLPEEAHILVRELASLRIPIAAVLGNHDFESGQESEVSRVLSDAGVLVLDGDTRDVLGIGLAGVKGFGGGFGRRTLAPWGEPMVKRFVNEAVEETLKLEKALARLRTEGRIAVLHYSPIQQTVEGEPLEIYPFLGSSRLEDPLNRYPVSLVLHGHAHRGRLQGATAKGVPVYNVSLPLLARAFPDQPPFRVFDVPATEVPACAASPDEGIRRGDGI
jgi:Icc-related predicted phosphoesterase